MQQNRMNISVVGNLVSGAIAGVIYAIIALITGARGIGVFWVALIVAVVTFVIAFIIGSAIRRRRGTAPDPTRGPM